MLAFLCPGMHYSLHVASPFEELCRTHGGRWPALKKARTDAEEQRKQLLKALDPNGSRIGPDTNLLVFGSLARGEWTSGSDVDWTLLVDGQTAPEHMQVAKGIEQSLAEGEWLRPGQTGIFGSLAFSHSLVHDIGGVADSHINTTRRILLLLESKAIGDRSVRDRVVRAVLARYLEAYTHFHPAPTSRSFVPRFLLNDVVRYWRTIGVDYANKTREISRRDWALRNVKLRMSRKMTFVSGMLMCFLCHLEGTNLSLPVGGASSPHSNSSFINYLMSKIDESPIDILAYVALRYDLPEETITLLFDSYDYFLREIGDPVKRASLKELTLEQSSQDALFQGLRETSHKFEEGLRLLFFDQIPDMTRLTQIYGVF